MKVAISIPDDVFQEAERLAAQLETSRSQLYARALQEYLSRHDEEQVTAAINEVVDDVGDEVDGFTSKAASRRLRQVDW